MSTMAPITQPAAGRGDRLHPSRASRIYWHLTCLRRAIEDVIDEFLPAKQPSGCLVDYGCGNMPYRPLFEPKLEAYIGCDFPGNEAADRIMFDRDRAPVDDGEADFVLSTQVLEHVAEPVAYLAECRRMLGPGGHLILSTHGIWRYHPDPRDYWRWTSEGLRKAVEEAGFEVVRFRGIMGEAAIGMQLWQDEAIQHMHPRIARLFTFLMQHLIERVDRRYDPACRDASASVFLLVARPA
ncbi:MAG: class I SAM-dependent methyltransferase [Isosphaeraceae bacterium]